MTGISLNLDLSTIVNAVTAGLLIYGGKVLHGTSVAVAEIRSDLRNHEKLDEKRFQYVDASLNRQHAAAGGNGSAWDS
jgi:hypothetical protein